MKRRRFISMLLAVCMLIGMMPMSVFAAGSSAQIMSGYFEWDGKELKANENASATVTE